MTDLVDLYAEALKERGSKDSSLRVVQSNLRTVAADCAPLDQLTPEQVTGWLDSRRNGDGAPIEPATRWNYISGLNRFYSWAIESGHLTSNPVAGMSKPPVQSAEVRTISYEELQQAINTAPDELRCWLILAAYQGLRPQDVAMLEWSEVDTSADPPALHLRREGPGDRSADLNPRTLDALEDLPGPRDGRLFPTITAGALSTRINRHLDALGIRARGDDLRSWYKSDEYWRHELSLTEPAAPTPSFCDVIKRAIAEYDPEAQEPSILAASDQRRDFLAAFPIENWPTMALDRYALGQPEHPDNFCRWIQFVTTNLGSMKGGNAKKHLIYRQATGDWYYDTSRYTSVDDAWNAVREGFVEALALAGKGEWAGIGQIEALRSGPALVNKTLAAYFEGQLLPINSQNHLRHFLSALGAPEAEDASLGTTLLNRALLEHLRECPELSGWTTKEMERLLYCTSLSPIAASAPQGPIADVLGFVMPDTRRRQRSTRIPAKLRRQGP